MAPYDKRNKGRAVLGSITNEPRLSNFELLRMFAMFLVLVTHSNLVSIGMPSLSGFLDEPSNAFTRTIIESISIVCVNVFILISGWFGINPSLRSFSNFIFQCAYFLIGIYVISLFTGFASLSIVGIMECLCLTNGNWFIQAYIGLYILSPILNKFVEKTDKRILQVFIIAFYCFQTYFGLLRSATFIVEGYSTFSFIGLYILARYIRLFGRKNYKSAWLLYAGSIILNTIIYPIRLRFFPVVGVFNYINPLVVIGSVGLLLLFAQIHIRPNKAINFISKSCFAVYLLHTQSNLYPIFIKAVNSIYGQYSGLMCLSLIFGFLVLVYFVSVIIDQPRRLIWKFLSENINWERRKSQMVSYLGKY